MYFCRIINVVFLVLVYYGVPCNMGGVLNDAVFIVDFLPNLLCVWVFLGGGGGVGGYVICLVVMI